jgi:hypothetical protein
MADLQILPEDEDANYGSFYFCLDCEWNGHVNECEFDYEYDEFSGSDRKYPICPECGGGVDC